MNIGIDALLIEDNLSDALLFESIVNSSKSSQVNLHHTERFEEALLALSNNPFDVILLDLCLPDGKGVELVKQLKEHTPQIPIVILTGIQDQQLAIAALREGAQDYLVKSDTFSPKRLKSLGLADVGDLLVKTLHYAIERAELAKELEVTQERYSLAVEGAQDGIWDWDLENNYIYYSPRWQEIAGINSRGSQNDPEAWLSLIHPQDRAHFNRQFQAHINRDEQQFQCEYRLLHSDGSYHWMMTRGMALWDDDNIAYRIAGSQTDITERKSLENALYQEKELAQITLHSIGDAVITTDKEGNIKDFNPVAERLTGWSAKAAKRQPITKVCNIIDGSTGQRLTNPAVKAIEEGAAVTLSNHPTLISKTGEEFAIGDSAAPIRSTSGEIVGTVLVFHDVTEERGRAKQLAWQASHDPLTHLYNRQKFITCLDSAIAQTKLGEMNHVLCCMDLDHFKAVNDTCGHAAGDELLKQISEIWGSQIRASDILARLGGDEFGLLLYDCDLERATIIANNFCDSIQKFRFAYDDKVFNVGVSIGVVPISGNSINDTQQALKLGDSACYSAKNKGRNRAQVYYPNDDDIAQQSADGQWFSRITEALDKDQFCLYQQVITSAVPSTDDPNFCEILLRLRNRHSNELSLPMAFIPPAERYNLMPKIDRWVVSNFLAHLETNPTPENTVYTLNLSGCSINDEKFITFLKEQFSQHSVNPKQICFEITETVAISNLQKAAAFMLEIKQLGCQFALDDFGSGMSSFSYLRNLPVDYLKIDGNFVKEAPTDEVTCAMLEAINQVGHVMGLKTIAEYVENQAILDKVRSLGIDFVQGYRIGRPQAL